MLICQQKCYLQYKLFGFLSKLLASLMRFFFQNGHLVARFILCQNHTSYDVPVGFVAHPPPNLRQGIALFVVTEGCLFLDIGRFVLFLPLTMDLYEVCECSCCFNRTISSSR